MVDIPQSVYRPH